LKEYGLDDVVYELQGVETAVQAVNTGVTDRLDEYFCAAGR
jgi:hypothetical protein